MKRERDREISLAINVFWNRAIDQLKLKINCGCGCRKDVYTLPLVADFTNIDCDYKPSLRNVEHSKINF